MPPLAAYQSGINGMVFYNNTIHDFDLARWLMRDEVTEVHSYTTVAIRPEVAQYGDVVASVVNLKYERGAIGNVESYVQAIYGYDVRTEIVGSKGSILHRQPRKDPSHIPERERRHAYSCGPFPVSLRRCLPRRGCRLSFTTCCMIVPRA